MKPYGWDNGRHGGTWKATKTLPSVRMTAHARRWETVEINAALSDIIEERLYADDCHGCGAPMVYCYCAVLESYARFGDCWCDACVSFEAPPIPRVTMFDTYKAKRK